MIVCKYFQIFILLLTYLRQTSQCNSSTLVGCLVQKKKETIYQIQSKKGYGYGFWFQFLSTDHLFSSNQNKEEIYEASLISLEQDAFNNLRLLFYYDLTNNSTNNEKYLYFKTKIDDKIQQLIKPIYNSFTFDGKWIYAYISYQFPNQGQIILYDLTSNEYQGTKYITKQDMTIDQITLHQRRIISVTLKPSNKETRYLDFPGRISEIYFNQNNDGFIFKTLAEFYSYLHQQFIPQPFCQIVTYDSPIIQNYNYIFGLIHMESWVKINYPQNINQSVSFFGVDLQDFEGSILYQKLIDLQYYVIQAWKQELINGVYFQTFYQKEPDYYMDGDQFYYQDKFPTQGIPQDLRQWHFVSMLFGFDKFGIPVSNLKIWFNDESTIDIQYHNRTFHFETSYITIRNGVPFNRSTKGIQAIAQSSKITLCIEESFEQVKKCHHSCENCKGPNFDQCQSCSINQNRYLDNDACKCNLGYIESKYEGCIRFQDFFKDSIQLFNQINQTASFYGYFPIKLANNETVYQRCPNFKEDQLNKIFCIECLSEPESFVENLVCESDYIFNNYGQYEQMKRDEVDVELFYLDIQTSEILLCAGCKSYCNPDIQSNCYFHNFFKINITCHSNQYYYQGECKACSPNCLTCNDYSVCKSCQNQMVLNPQTNTCIQCEKECLQCEYNPQLSCKKCIEKYTVFQGQCKPCGKNCLECIETKDSFGEIYIRCIQCIDNNKYYLSLNAFDCLENLNPLCKYVIQFHKTWLMRSYDNTMFHLFPRRELDPNQIFNYCALCLERYASLITGECVKIDTLNIDNLVKIYCVQMYQTENNEFMDFKTILNDCITLESNTYDTNVYYSSSEGCQIILENCDFCFLRICVYCYPGFYADLQKGICIPCPIELSCQRCEQRSKVWKNGWKVWYILAHHYFGKGSFYDDVFGNEAQDQLEVVCKTCTGDFEFYQDRCIKKCPENCELCIKNRGENQCVKCKVYKGRRLSLYQGECIDCPRYCQICKSNTKSQLLQVNPYFSNDEVISSTRTCFMLQTNLNIQDYYYNTKFKQFFKISETSSDYNYIVLKFNLYCDIELYIQQLEMALNKEEFLNQNIKLDEIFSNNQTQSNFSRIENINLYTYLSAQQIQHVDLQITFIHDCIVDYHSYIFTTLIQNIYFIETANIQILGSGNRLFLQQNLEIINFNSISISNLIIIPSTNSQLYLKSLSKLEVLFQSVIIQQLTDNQSKMQFTIFLSNIRKIQISQFQLFNLNLIDVTSLFKVQNSIPQQFIDFSFNQLTIQNSIFYDSNIVQLDSQQIQEINIQFHKVLIQNSSFYSSKFLTTFNLYTLTIKCSIFQVEIIRSYFQNIMPFFQTKSISNLTINGIHLQNTTFKNFTLFQPSILQYNSNYSINFCQLYNSSIINPVGDSEFQSIFLDNMQFKDNEHDQYSIFIKLISSDQRSKIIMSKVIFDTLTIFQNIQQDSSFSKTQSIIILQSDLIQISNLTIIRSKGVPEIYIQSATNLILQDIIITLNEKYFFPSIQKDYECKNQNQTEKSKHSTSLYIQNVQAIIIEGLFLNNLIIFDLPIIEIVSISTQIQRRSEKIQMENININNCIIQKTQTIYQISQINIKSEQQLEIDIINSKFENNVYHSYDKESESESALNFIIIAFYAQIRFINCQFNHSYISQSQNSLLYITSQKIEFIKTSFTEINDMSIHFLKHVDWKYIPYNLTLNQIQNQFQVLSQSGVGSFQITKIVIKNSKVQDTFSTSAGCFKIVLENDGEIYIQDSEFMNINTQIIEEQTFGGCFYIIDRSVSIQIHIISTIYNMIFGTAEGGVLYLQPNSQNINFNFSNLTIIDVYSNDGNLIKLNFLNENQQFQISNSLIVQTLKGYSNFLSKFKQIKPIQTAMISIQQGNLNFINLFVKLYISSFLYLTQQSKIRLTSIEISNSYYYSNPTILILFPEDQKCKIEINGLEIKNFRFYKDDPEIEKQQVQMLIQNQQLLTQNCQNLNQLSINNSTFDTLSLTKLMPNSKNLIESLIQIKNVKQGDQITIKSVQFLNNFCKYCQTGLLLIKLIEDQSSNFVIQNVWLMDNQCGQNGCIYFQKEIQNQTKVNNFVFSIEQMICYRNIAIKGGCIASKGIGFKIEDSIFSENIAQEKGGCFYYEGENINLLFQKNLIVSNTAQEGGAIYIGNNTLPELSKTLNYLINNRAHKYGNISSSRPTQLIVMYRGVFYNTTQTQSGDIFIAYLQEETEQDKEKVLIFPNGQKLSSYQYFNTTSQEYQNLNLNFRILALNHYHEQQYYLNNTVCQIKSGYKSNEQVVFTNNFTNYKEKQFDSESQDYNFDDLIVYFSSEQRHQHLALQLNCDSIQIPIQNSVFPYQILNYSLNYNLNILIKTYPCQLGEYKNLTNDACSLCEVDKKQYSVRQNATACEYMNEETTISIKPAQLQLKSGYWRPFINSHIIEQCQNRIENCQGGWKQGDQTCKRGQLGACCESCDYYNVRGDGKFSLKKIYQCQKCDNNSSQIGYVVLIALWNLFSIQLTIQGVEKMILELQRNKIGNRQLLTNKKKQTGPLMKVFINYLQIITIILNFNVEIPSILEDYYQFFGNSQQMLIITTDCFLAEYFSFGLIYVKIIYSIICPMFYGLFYLLIYSILKILNKVVFNQLVVSTCILYLFCYFQLQVIQLLISSLSFRELSQIKWIQANMAYQFDQLSHQSWIPILVGLIIVIGVIVPGILVFGLIKNKLQLQKFDIRRKWGYLFLEYQPKAFYWEAVKIIVREMIIVASTFYQDNILIKSAILFVIIFVYFYSNYFVLPFQTKDLNLLEQKSLLICTFTLLAVTSLSQLDQQQSILIQFIIVPNLYLFFYFFYNVIKGYLESYEETIDKVKDFLRKKMILQIKYNPNLDKWLINKGQRRKVIMERFKSIKYYLYSVKKELNKIESQPFSKENQQNDIFFKYKPVRSNFSEYSRTNDPKIKFITNITEKK